DGHSGILVHRLDHHFPVLDLDAHVDASGSRRLEDAGEIGLPKRTLPSRQRASPSSHNPSRADVRGRAGTTGEALVRRVGLLSVVAAYREAARSGRAGLPGL